MTVKREPTKKPIGHGGELYGPDNAERRDHIERAQKAILVCVEIIDDSTPHTTAALSYKVSRVMINALRLDKDINDLLLALDNDSVV